MTIVQIRKNTSSGDRENLDYAAPEQSSGLSKSRSILVYGTTCHIVAMSILLWLLPNQAFLFPPFILITIGVGAHVVGVMLSISRPRAFRPLLWVGLVAQWVFFVPVAFIAIGKIINDSLNVNFIGIWEIGWAMSCGCVFALTALALFCRDPKVPVACRR